MRPCSFLLPTPAKWPPTLLTKASSYASPRKAQESQKEMKLLLDMYKSAPKEQRDKVQLMAAERKAKAEVRAGRAYEVCREAAPRGCNQSRALGQQEAVTRELPPSGGYRSMSYGAVSGN